MALQVKIIDNDGNVREVELEPGTPLVLAPGETVVLTPDAALEISTRQEGADLVLATADGEFRVGDFFTPPEEEGTTSALGYLDEGGFHLLTPSSSFADETFIALGSDAYFSAETVALPETYASAADAARASELADLLPVLFGETGAGRAGVDDGEDNDERNEADDTEIFAGFLNAEPAVFTLESDFATAREGQLVTFSVTRSGNLSGTDTIDFRTQIRAADGASGTTPGDFEMRSLTLTFAPNETVKTITVALTQDGIAGEGAETFFAEILNARSGQSNGTASIADGDLVVTIQNNDIPVNAVPGAQVTAEDTPIVFTGATAISVTDGDGDALTVTLSATNGRLTAGATAPGAVITGNGSGQLVVTGSAAAINTVLDGLQYQSNLNFNGAASIAINSSDGIASDQDNVAVSVTAVNDAPVVNIAIATQLSAVLEGAGPPVGVVGTAVSALIDLAGGGGLNNATDPDGPGLGIAVTFVDTTNGTWFYSIDNGTSWNAVGVVNNANSLLLSNVNGRLFFQPTTPDFSGTITGAAVFRGWDQSSGVNGTKVDTSVTGAATAFSVAAESASINVTNINDTVVLNAAATPLMNAVDEDAAAPAGAVGTQVSDLVANGSGINNASDPDGPGLGIAVTALDSANGAWWYSTNNGASWSLVGAVANNNALLLSGSGGRLFFQPTTANFNGTVSNAITFRAWDEDSGTNGAKADTTVNGDPTAFSTATDSADIVVTAVNDAPINNLAATSDSVAEDNPLTFNSANGNLITVSDVDVGGANLSISLSANNGTLTLNPGATGALVGLIGDGTGTVAFDGTVAQVNAALDGLVYLGNPGFSGSETITITTNDNGVIGTGGALQDVDNIAVTVIGVNDTPVLSAAATPVMSAVNEDAGMPVGAVGTAVSSLVDLASVGGGLDNVTDPDGPGLGIALTNVDTSNGTWWFSIDNGTSWSTVPAVAANNALLLSGSNGRLSFQANADFNGTVTNAVTFHAWDEFNTGTFVGTNGTLFDPLTAGAESPLSAATDTANITVTAVNDAPQNVLASMAETINEDNPLTFDAGNGNLISVGDVDVGGANLSVTLNVTSGTLTLNPAATGVLIGLAGDGTATVTFDGTVAQVNAALDGMVYLGNTGFSGAETLTITTNDNGATGSGGAQQDSDAVAITIIGVNDIPVLNAAATPVLSAVAEDAGMPVGAVGTAVASLVANGSGINNVADPDGPGLGIAITDLDTTNGAWWFSTDGGANWSLIGAVSTTNALLLSGTNGRVFFQGNSDFNGTVSSALTFRAWDEFTNGDWTGVNGTKTSTTLALPETPFSAASDVANITVSAVNDAPVNTLLSSVEVATEDTPLVFNAGNGNLVSVGDVDAGATNVSVTLAVTNGTLTLNPAATGVLVGLAGDGTGTVTFDGTVAQVNAALDGMVYQGTLSFSGADTLTVTTNDNGATGSGGALQDVDMIDITVTGVNDAPVLNNALTPVLSATAEDNGAPSGAVGTAVASLVANGSGINNVSDPDGTGLGIAITNLDTTNGTWWFSTNNGASWSLVGAVANNNALLLSGTNGRVYFQGNLNFTGTVTNAVTFRAWDETTGTNGTKTDTSTNGDATAFSTATDVANITVSPVNDAPVNTLASAAETVAEDTALTFSAANGNLISVGDVDAGASNLSVTLTVGSGTLTLNAAATGVLVGLTGDGTGTVSFDGTVAQVNAALNGMAYLGNLGFSGAETLTITTNDNGATGSGGALQDVDAVAITVTGVNDTPVLNAAATPVLVTLNEDAGAPVGAVGTTVASLVANGSGINNVSDPDGPGLGIAITNLNTANGQWWFSTNDGANWSLVGGVANNNALLLSGANGRLYFQSNANFNGTITNAVTFHAWDQFTTGVFTGTNGTKFDPQTIAPESPFSSATDSANITVNAINDAPVNTLASTAEVVVEDNPLTFNAANGNLISVNDVDSGASNLSVSLSVANGTLTLNPAATGVLVGLAGDGTNSVSFDGTVAQVNAALDGLVYLGNTNFSGFDTLTITTSDNGASGAGGVLQDVDVVNITISGSNDSPVLNNLATPVMATVAEDSAPPVGAVGTAVSALVANGAGINNVSDPDGTGLGIAITNLNTANGTWWFSTDNGANWLAVGAVANNNALLLSATNGRIHFQPTTLDFTGTVASAVTFRAWDETSGTNGQKVDTSVNGDPTAFSTATDTADVTVTGVNDAPVNTLASASETVNEDVTLTFNAGNGNLISVGDVDAGASNLSVTLAVSNGTLTLNPGATGVLVGLTGNGTGTVSFDGTVAQVNAALDGMTYLGNLGFSGAETLTITTNDNGATGSGGALQDVDVVNITITGVNDTPVLNAAATPVLGNLAEDTGAPSGAVGTTVASLVANGSGINNVSDPDGPGLGIAITNLDTTNGTWWFSTNNGGSWSLVGAVSATNALLVSGTSGRVYFQGNLNFNGTVSSAITFKAWDEFTNGDWTGTNGTKTNTTLAFAETPFSTATDTANVTVTAVNDAPVNTLLSTSETVAEDTALTFNAGNGNLISVGDVDAGATNLSVTLAVTNGTLTLNPAATGVLVGLAGDGTGTVSFDGTVAQVNAALDGMVYQGTLSFSGADTLTITTNDNGATGSGGALQDVDGVNITVTGVNDAPVLNAAAAPVLGNVAEDNGAPSGAVGTTVASLVANGSGINNVGDPDGPGLGIAITNLNTANGTWWFSTNDGASWSLVGAVANNNALLLSGTNGRVYFQGNLNFNGTVSSAVTFRAWDQSTGLNGTKADTTTNGDPTAFSTATDTANVTATAVNDAPVNTLVSVSETVAEDTALTFNAGNGNLISVGDVDAGATNLSVTLAVTNGTLTLNPAATGVLVGLAGDGTGTVSFDGTVAQVNAALDGMVYQGSLSFSGADTLTITTNDNGATGSGGALQDVDMIDITVTGVNDAPVLNNALTPVLSATAEDNGAPSGAVGTAVASLVANGSGINNVSDPDGTGLGIAITNLDTTNGTWWFSTNNGANWSLVGAVANNNALLLSGTNGRVYFQGNLNFTGTVTNAVTFRAWDETSGANGTKADTTTNGDPTAFSTATDTANVTATPVNDAPVNTLASASETVNEDVTLTFNTANGNLISVGDVDAGASNLSVTLAVSNGTLTLNPGATGVLVGLTGNGTGTVSFDGTVAQVNAALDGMTYLGNLGFSGAETLTITTNDNGATGSGGALQDVDVVNITITGVNDTPVLNAAATPVLGNLAEDTGAPSGAVGTTVASLVANGSGINNVSDPDGPGLGIAITNLDTANGTWWFSTNNGGSWSLVGAVSATNALLVSGTSGRVYFQGNLNFNGTVSSAITFKAWDEFTNGDWTGTNGTKTNTTLAFAETPFSTATDTANVTVTAVNDAPVNTLVSASETVAEDTALTFNAGNGNLISVGDVDAGATNLSVTLAVTNGTLTLNPGATGVLVGLTGNGTGTVSFDGTVAQVNAALDGMVYQGTLSFSGADTLTITTNDNGATGSGGALQDVDMVNITVTGVNDAPVLNAAATPVLGNVAEDNGAPSGAVGTTVTSLVANGSGINNVGDPDGPGLGIAITNLDTANGTWWFSTNDGASWSLVGAVANNNALLLSGTNGRVYFQGNLNFNGTVASAITFRAWDQSTGLNGTKADTTTNGDPTAFSTATDTANVTATAVNDAPVNTLVSASETVAEDTALTFNAGNGNLITVGDVDSDPSNLSITLAVSNGSLTLNPGATGPLVGLTGNGTGTVSFDGTVAQVNAALDGMVYQGSLSFSGADTLTITTNDNGATGSGGALQDVDMIDITVTGVNDAPVLNAAATPVLGNVAEDNGAPSGAVGTTVASLVANGSGINNVGDPDGPGLGIAITNLNAANGTWWFSTNDGASWALVGAVANNNALLLSGTNGRVYFQGNLNFNGTVASAITFRAWDQSTGLNGTKADTTTNGDPTAFSTATDTANVTATAVNDAPVNTLVSASETVAEDTALTFNAGNGNLITVGDVDSDPSNLSITLAVSNGSLTLNPGATGPLVGLTGNGTGTVSFDGTVAQVNAALDGMVYQGTLSFSGADTLTITTNDNGATGSGGALQDVDGVNITVTGVNDAPVLNAAATPVLGNVAEDNGAPSGAVGTTVASLVANGSGINNVGDPDGPGLGIAITNLNTANGTWWFSTNDGASWSLVGAVANNNALLLSGTNGRVYFQGNLNFNGTVTNAVTFRAWDETSGTNGQKVDTSVNGDPTAFSTATDTADVTVTGVNDAPVNTLASASETVNEDVTLTFNAGNGNLISVGDVDAGASNLSVTLAVSNGTLTLNPGATGVLVGLTGNGTGTVSFDGTVAQVNAALDGMTYLGNLGFSGAETLTITTNDNGATGSGGALQDVDVVSITITGVNDTPVLNAAATPVLGNLAEDTGAPSGAVGTTVASLVANGSGINNVGDPDGPGLGIAITNLDTTNGTWWFSTNNGGSWSLVGAVSATNALLVSGTSGRVYFQGNLNFNGTVSSAITFKAWDEFTNGDWTGTNGTKTNTTLAFAETPFSTATDTANVTVTAVNDAPVNTLLSTSETVAEDTALTFNAGNGNLITVGDVDSDPSNLSVTLAVSNGTLTLNPAATGVLVGLAGDGTDTVTFDGTVAQVNAALDGMVYQGSLSFSGADTLTITTNDNGATGSGGALQDVDGVNITVTGVNDAPVLNAAATPVLGNVAEDNGAPSGAVGTTVTSLVANGSGINNVSDPDGPGLGIAITNLNTANGTWWFSTNDGASWSLVGAVANNNALLLSGTNGRVYFQGNLNFNGTVASAITFRAWDQSTGLNGTKADTTTNGDPTAFSTATDTANVTATAVNDAPVNTLLSTSETVAEDTALTFNAGNGNLLTVGDVDSDPSNLSVTLAVSNGTLTLNPAATGVLVGLAGDGTDTVTFDGTVAQVNAALDGMVYQGSLSFSGADTLTITTNDNGATGSGGALQDVDGVNITVTGVNDAPVLNAAATPVLGNVAEDNGAPSGAVGTTVASLVANGSGINNVSDPDGPGLGIAITNLNAANGTWWFSTNDGASWSLVGAVANNNALLLSGTNGRVYFQGNLNFNGTVSSAVTFRAWDQSTGLNGTKADTTTNGDPTAFSTATDTANVTATAVNDAPVNVIGNSSIVVAEDALFDFTAGNAMSVNDVDAGSNPLTVTLSVNNGSLVFTAGTGGLTGDVDGSDGSVSFGGNLSNINSALAGLRYQPTGEYSGPDTLTITSNDQGNSGADPGLTGGAADEQDQDVITISVVGDNDSPVLNAAATPVLSSIAEDSPVPVGTVGTAISDLVDLDTVGGGLDNVTDPDGPDVGIAVTALDSADGTWWFSINGGTNWSNVGVVSTTNALLLSGAGARLYFEPDPDFAGTIVNAVTFKAWDGFTDGTWLGTNGTKFDTTLIAPESPFSSSADNANLTVSALNDAPVNTLLSVSETVPEDTGLTFNVANGNLISVDDVDVGGSNLAVTLTVTDGTLTLNPGATGALASLIGDGSNTVAFEGTVAQVNAALDGMVYLGSSGFSGADTLTITTDDQGATGFGSALQDVDVVNITVTGVNDAPVLNNAPTPTMASVNEDATGPSGAVGTAVSALVANGTGINNVADPDGPGLGVAITGLNTANGTWHFSTNNGASWSLVGAVSSTNALLLSATNGRLFFQPTTTDFNGTVTTAVTYRAWDQSTGVNGSKVNPGAGGGSSAFSTVAESETADVVVNAVNDAPVNASASGFATEVVAEDTARLFTGANALTVSDVDIVGDLAMTLAVSNGTLTLGTTAGLSGLAGNGTATVTFQGTVAEVNAALNNLSYLGNNGFSGADTLTITSNDQGSFGSGGALQDVDVVNITVTGVNDAPVLNNAPTPTMASVNEDATGPSGAVGTAVSALVANGTGINNVADPDGPGLGVAITGLNTANGTWHFSTNNGASWSLVGAVSSTNALLLSATNGRLFFQPTTTDFNGTVTTAVTYRAWDQSTGVNGSKVNPGAGGGSSAFSTVAESETADVVVNAVNDAPVNASASGFATEVVAEDTARLFTGANALTVSDVDIVGDLAMTLAVSNGTLTLGTTAGLSGLAGNGTATVTFQGTVAEVNAALNNLSYLGNNGFSGADTLTITSNDQGSFGSGGALQDVDVVNITVTGVNDAPVLNNAPTPTMASVNEDATGPSGAVGTAVSALVANGTGINNVADPDGPGLGVAITGLNTANGTWHFSTNNGASWSLVGAVSSTNALLLSATNGRLFFQPTTTDFNGTVTTAVTYRAWDQSTGVNGSKVNPGAGGGSSAFSTVAESETADVVVNAVNDAPVNASASGFATEVVAEDTARLFTGANALTVSDVDIVGDLAMTLAVSNGTLTLGTTAGLSGLAGNGTATVTFQGTVAEVNAALNNLSYLGNNGFSGADTLTITSNDQGSFGSGGALQDVDVVNITVTGVNDAPVLNAAATPVLDNVDEDAGAPTGTVGTTVATLIDLAGGGGLNNVTDPDGPGLGIAITALNTTNGQWHFSTNNGASWSLVGAVSATNALLLSATGGRLYFETTPPFDGLISNAVTFRAWDQLTGANGTKVNPGATGGSSAFSTATDTADITVDPASAVVPVSSIDLSTLDGTAGFKINGFVGGSFAEGDRLGSAVAGIGDVNGDGLPDILIGAEGAELPPDAPGGNVGKGYVLFGSATLGADLGGGSTAGFEVNTLAGTDGITIVGSNFAAQVGASGAGGGDFNGDMVADFILGTNAAGGPNAAYVVYGDDVAAQFSALDGVTVNTFAGFGDFNSDGVDDGAELSGIPNFGSVIGVAVGNAGDIDNDGIDDIAVGAALFDFGGNTDSGNSFIVFGDSTANLDALASLGSAQTPANDVLSFPGGAANQFVGRSMTGIGDINNDGFDDFIIGATPDSGQPGMAYVIFGDDRDNGSDTNSNGRDLTTLSNNIINKSGGYTNGLDSLNGSNGGFIISDPVRTFNGTLGRSTSGLGDFNGDGFDDFILGGGGFPTAHVIFGKASGWTNLSVENDLNGSSAASFVANGFTLLGGNRFGESVAGAGDVNGDGLDDLLVGVRNVDQAVIIFGTTDVSPLLTVPNIYGQISLDNVVVDLSNGGVAGQDGFQLLSGGTLHGAGVLLQGVAASQTGSSVAGAGDVNNDGFDDVIVGANNADPGSRAFAGQAYVVFGESFSGTAPCVNMVATTNGEVLLGGADVDTLSSGGFTGVVQRAGAGDDVLRINGTETRVDAGGGKDILTPDATGIALDFASLSNKGIYSDVEQIQLNGFGANSLALDVRDVLEMSSVSNELLVTGDAGVDSVTLNGSWMNSGPESRLVEIAETSSSELVDFTVYTNGSNLSVLVEQDLLVAVV